MSSEGNVRHEKVVRYLVTALQMNPTEESGLLISRRNQLLGLQTKDRTLDTDSHVQYEDRQKLRQELAEKIEHIRKEFWTLDIKKLRSSLANFKCEEFPDLNAIVTRLSTIAAHRERMPSITQSKGFNASFFEVFREVLTSSPRESAVLRERVLAQCGKAKQRRRAKQMIQLIQKELPELYELEAGWLSSLINQRNSKLTAGPQKDTWDVTNGKGGLPWWWLVVAITIIRIVVRAMAD